MPNNRNGHYTCPGVLFCLEYTQNVFSAKNMSFTNTKLCSYNGIAALILGLSKIQANYTLEGTVLENVESIKYLGVTITNDLKWNTHISNVCTKANITL